MGSVIPEKHGVMKSNQWSASTKPLLMNFDESLACTLAREAPITKRESIRQRLMLRVFLNSCSLLFEFGYLYHCAPPRRSRSNNIQGKLALVFSRGEGNNTKSLGRDWSDSLRRMRFGSGKAPIHVFW